MLNAPTLACSLVATAAVVLLAGCGKPENSAYTSDAKSDVDLAALNAPLPPAPAWASQVVGQPISAVAKGATTCKGVIDVTLKHAPHGHVGYELQGWAWDLQAKAPPARVILVDPTSKVIGAGEINRDRPDVPKALVVVKSSRVGWTAVTGVPNGTARVMGLSSTGALCPIGVAQLS